jgi:hypothetical protein
MAQRTQVESEMIVIRRILRAAEQLSPASLAWLRAQLALVQSAPSGSAPTGTPE